MAGEVQLADGVVLRVERQADEIVLGVAGAWTQRLTLEECWQLAELLDETATAAAENEDNDDLLVQ